MQYKLPFLLKNYVACKSLKKVQVGLNKSINAEVLFSYRLIIFRYLLFLMPFNQVHNLSVNSTLHYFCDRYFFLNVELKGLSQD